MILQDPGADPEASEPNLLMKSSSPALKASVSLFLAKPVRTVNLHCWPFLALGAQVPASMTLHMSSMGTGSSLNLLMLRLPLIAVISSMRRSYGE